MNAIGEVGESGAAVVSTRLGDAKASTSVAVNQLVALKLAVKKPATQDKRGVILKLTASARALVTAKRRALEDYAAHASVVLGPKEITRLESILSKLTSKDQR